MDERGHMPEPDDQKEAERSWPLTPKKDRVVLEMFSRYTHWSREFHIEQLLRCISALIQKEIDSPRTAPLVADFRIFNSHHEVTAEELTKLMYYLAGLFAHERALVADDKVERQRSRRRCLHRLCRGAHVYHATETNVPTPVLPGQKRNAVKLFMLTFHLAQQMFVDADIAFSSIACPVTSYTPGKQNTHGSVQMWTQMKTAHVTLFRMLYRELNPSSENIHQHFDRVIAPHPALTQPAITADTAAAAALATPIC